MISNIVLVLTDVRNGVSIFAHPLIYVRPVIIFQNPQFTKRASVFTYRVAFGTSQCDLTIVLIGFDRLRDSFKNLFLRMFPINLFDLIGRS